MYRVMLFVDYIEVLFKEFFIVLLLSEDLVLRFGSFE